jgi:chorismate dehydratase
VAALFTVGCVPYVNAIPLVMGFVDSGDASPVKVLYDVPSRLPELLNSGEAQVILVSSIDAFRSPGRRMATGVCIGSDGPVKSVRLFSKVPPSEIRTLALDQASLTSNRLAQLILASRYGCRPSLVSLPPDLRSMLAVADACVLIGDIGMAADETGLHVLDLGLEWQLLTGKPFVWAAWIGGEGLTPALSRLLYEGAANAFVGRTRPASASEVLSEEVLAKLVGRAVNKAHWKRDAIEDYFMNVMVYEMDDRMLEGLREFQTRLLGAGFDDCAYFPSLV